MIKIETVLLVLVLPMVGDVLDGWSQGCRVVHSIPQIKWFMKKTLLQLPDSFPHAAKHAQIREREL